MNKLVLAIASCLFYSIIVHAQVLETVNLRCEYRNNPSGIDDVHPKLSWQIRSDQQEVLQTAYQILVADDSLLLKKDIGNTWDSKKVASEASIQIPCGASHLGSAKKYYWKVRMWDNKGNLSAWSSVASWQMGLLKKEDWSGAQWIGYEAMHDSLMIAPHMHQNGKKAWGLRKNVLPLLRKSFTVGKKIQSATIFISGLGHFDLSINGKKVSDDFLAPGWTNYAKQAQYVTYNITQHLQKGNNVIGVMLGNGFYYIPSERYRKMTGGYGFPKAIAKAIITFTDGTQQEIITDESWKTAPSPIFYSSIFGGEDYDAGRFQQGWNKPGFKDAAWKKAVVVDGPPELIAEMQEPVKIMEQFTVKQQRTLKPGVTVYDLAQNFSGIPAITVKGNKGDTIRMHAAELLNEDGTVNQKATGRPSFFTYVIGGGNTEIWQPQFTYTGFRYVEVHCIPKNNGAALPQVLELKGLHIRNATATTGNFNCSNELFNKTHTLIDWAIKSNMVSVFTDCPHREKLGWLEQTHLMGASVHYRYHSATLNRKMITDMQQTQYPDGKIPEIAPEYVVFTPPFDESPEWGSASIILPWYNYKWYGDKETLTAAYPMMKRYLNYLSTKANNHILSHGLGDWFDIGPNKSGFSQMTRMGITATATYYYNLNIMVQVANLLNKPDDAQHYRQWAAAVKESFNHTFFDKEKLQYDASSQTANAMALYMGLTENKHKDVVVDALLREIKGRNFSLTAGDIGYRYVLKALQQANRSDVIFNMNYRDDVPGYGFQLKHGATALTESWQAYASVSNNHFMLGHLMEWFYSALAGIQQESGSVAYRQLIFRPEVEGDVTSAEATFKTGYGMVKSSWKKVGNDFEIHVSVPPNCTATLELPAQQQSRITLNGKQVEAAFENGRIKIRIGSGNYQCSITTP